MPQAGTGGYGIRPYVFCGGRCPAQRRCPAWSFLPLVENEIRRGAFYMRPRRFILPQAGTGGYGIRPYVFCGGRCPAQRRCPAWSFLPLVENEIRRGAFYMRPRRFILPQAGTGGYGIRPLRFFVAGGVPPQRAVPRVELSPFVESEIRRGAFYMRPRRFILPQAGTGGYGIRPYVFEGAEPRPRGAFFPIVRASGFISACALSKTILCGILFLYKFTGKPGANRRRKAIGVHRVSQLPTRNCCFTAAGSFASFLGQELTRVKTHRYTGGTKQGIYNALLFSAARGYCLIRSDSAFRYGSAMP